jgi:hypothetical protein
LEFLRVPWVPELDANVALSNFDLIKLSCKQMLNE